MGVIHTGKYYTFLLLIYVFCILSCTTAQGGATIKEQTTEPQSAVLKNEGPPLPPTTGAGVSMRVLWTVSEYRLGTNAVWGNEEARKLLFQPLDIDVNYITFNGKTCRNVTFKKEQVKAKKYLAHAYKTTPKALGIEDETIEVIKTNCSLPGFAEYLRLKDRRLVIQINGVFFYLEPAVNY
jgi:hypothetical protein